MKRKYITLFFIVITFGSLFSCKKKLEDAYLNPNADVIEPIEDLLPGVIGSMVGASTPIGVSGGVAGDALVIGRYIQYWGDYSPTASAANLMYDQMGGPVTSSGTLATIWNGFYYGQGQNLNRILQWGAEQQKWDYVGVAYAIRAWGWLELANEYADGLIVKEAFDASRQVFDYDLQQDAYDACRTACFNALNNLNRTDGNVSQANLAIGDAFMNKGDVNKWKKFVYGVLARSYAYLTNKSNYLTAGYADSTIKYCELSIKTNADNTTAKFSGNTNISGNNSYYGPTRGNVGALRQAKYIVNLLTGQNSAIGNVPDPRAAYFLTTNLSGTYKGITPWIGYTEAPYVTPLSSTDPNFPFNFWMNPVPSSTSPPAGASTGGTELGKYLFRNAAEFPLMTASEIQFLEAEAYFRKGDKNTAQGFYVNGIKLNFDMLSANYNNNVPAVSLITPANRDAYVAAVTPPLGTLTLTQIMLQKYIALYGWGVQEVWSDMRRYHYTDLDPATGKQVYADFQTPLAAGVLYTNNNNKLVYRAKPQNNEYIYDIPSLTRIGALDLDYHTKQPWFILP